MLKYTGTSTIALGPDPRTLYVNICTSHHLKIQQPLKFNKSIYSDLLTFRTINCIGEKSIVKKRTVPTLPTRVPKLRGSNTGVGVQNVFAVAVVLIYFLNLSYTSLVVQIL